MWFRVEIAKDGSIASCALVENRQKGTATVVYVDADSDAKACEEALAWRRQFLARAAATKARNQAQRIARGQCADCPADAQPGKRRCHVCLEKSNARNAYRYKSGRQPLKPGPKPGTVQRTGERVRYELLLRVQEKHATLSRQQFVSWLRVEITSLKNRLAIRDQPEAAE